VNRERGRSHYGIGRTFGVVFDLLTIRFLLKYMTRPLHFFGTLGILSMLTGSLLSAALIGMKLLHHNWSVMEQHGPLVVIAGVLIVAGMQVRHYYTSQYRAPYAIAHMVRLQASEEPSLLPEA
jgi:hypothetical protein